jgi:hypothetical protein
MYQRTWPRGFSDSSVGRPAFVADHGIHDAEQTAAVREIEAALDHVDLVRVVFGDPHGLARSKTLTAETFRVALRNGMDFSPGPFLFDTAHAVAVDFRERDAAVQVDELTGARSRSCPHPGTGPPGCSATNTCATGPGTRCPAGTCCAGSPAGTPRGSCCR